MADGKRWKVTLRYKDWTGKTIQYKKEGFQRRADAKAFEEEFMAKVSGSLTMTYASFAEIYLTDCSARLRETTLSNKRFMIDRHILPFFGSLRMTDITPVIIRKWQNEMLQQDYSKTYLRTINNQLSAQFNFAVKYYGLKQNPVRVAGTMGAKHADEMQFWTLAEFQRFDHAASKDLRAQTAFQLLYWGGLRRGEVLALRPMDFDFKNDSVKIDHSYTRLKKQDIISDPKTAKSKRIVTLPHAVMELVQRYMDSIYHLKSSDRIFQSITHHALRKAMSRYQQEAGIKYIRLHDLRHSHASLLIERGYSPLLIAQRLGHENVETTLRTYAHLYPHKNEDLMADLNSLQKCYDSATPHKTA